MYYLKLQDKIFLSLFPSKTMTMECFITYTLHYSKKGSIKQSPLNFQFQYKYKTKSERTQLKIKT